MNRSINSYLHILARSEDVFNKLHVIEDESKAQCLWITVELSEDRKSTAQEGGILRFRNITHTTEGKVKKWCIRRTLLRLPRIKCPHFIFFPNKMKPELVAIDRFVTWHLVSPLTKLLLIQPVAILSSKIQGAEVLAVSIYMQHQPICSKSQESWRQQCWSFKALTNKTEKHSDG